MVCPMWDKCRRSDKEQLRSRVCDNMKEDPHGIARAPICFLQYSPEEDRKASGYKSDGAPHLADWTTTPAAGTPAKKGEAPEEEETEGPTEPEEPEPEEAPREEPGDSDDK